ncbi:unnamed protein product [Phytophthora fragariaefolia]|uniref:Unnamed protein product n=1 Tax=Phytophthora fragariaefolia TaxID=1490495 RepID=A0A9W6YC17_9STRA|nr:unnamed protein product [Phytophthora fragariaefolia]
MPHHAGVDLIRGTDFMIPAGIRLDLYNSTARLPDEVEIPLIKSRHLRVLGAQNQGLDTDRAHSSRDKLTRVLLTNANGKPVWCPDHFPVILWAPHGELPPDDGYVRLNSAKYSDWQVLAYEAGMDKDLLKREQRLYAACLARQPPAVERRQYAVPKDVMKRTPRRVDNGEAELTCAQQRELLERAAAASAETANDRTEAAVTFTNSTRDGLHKSETTEPTADDSVRYESAESAGDDSASSVQAVATSCELTDCHIADPAGAAQTDAAGCDDGPNAGAAHQSRLGVTILEAKSPDQVSERKHPSAELSADSKEKSLVREAIDSLLSNEIEVSDVALADGPEEDLRLRFVAAMAMCEGESITVVDNSATDPAEFESSANEIDLEDYAHQLVFLPALTDSASAVLDYGGSNVPMEQYATSMCKDISL